MLTWEETDAKNMQGLRTPLGEPRDVSSAMPRLRVEALEVRNQTVHTSVSELRLRVAELAGSTKEMP